MQFHQQVHVQVGDGPRDQRQHPDTPDSRMPDPPIRPAYHCAPASANSPVSTHWLWVHSPRRHQPPSGLVSLCQPDLAGHCSWRTVTHALVGALVDPGDHGSSSTVPAQFGPGDTGGVIRAAQVAGLFDLSPSSPPCRQVHEGPPQVHRRSVRAQRILARRRPARSRFIRVQSLHSAGHAQARSARPAARRGSATQFRPVQGSTPISAGSSRLPADSLSHARATTSDHQ